jgi:rRNA-processing protein FCF1
VTVIVLDTNAMPHGQYSAAFLRALKDLVGRGASLVVPEVVVWEWAEHARSAHVALEEAIKGHRVDRGILNHAAIESAPSIEDLVLRIEAKLAPDASVWRPSDDAWRGALRDQVLQIGSGETKSNVKTGASDAIVFACVEYESDHAEGAVVVLTSDRLLRKNIMERFDNVLTASGTGVLLATLSTFVPDPDDIALRLMEQLPDYLNERLGDHGGEILPFRDLGVAMEVDGEYYGSSVENGLASIMFTRVDIAEIHDFRVEADGAERIALAELRLFGTILADVLTYHEVSPGEAGASRETIDFSSHFVDVTVAVRWDLNWQIETVVPTGVAILVICGPDEEDADDVPRFRAEPLT